MFFSRNKKNNVYPSKPQFHCIKVGFKGVKIIKACFRDVIIFCTDETLICLFYDILHSVRFKKYFVCINSIVYILYITTLTDTNNRQFYINSIHFVSGSYL